MEKEKKIETPYYRSLKRNMIIIIIAVSFTPMFLVSGLILDQFHVSHHEKVYAHLGELVLKHKQNINTFLREKLNDIRFVANSFNFEELSDEHSLQEKLKALQQEYGAVFEDLGVVNAEGVQVAYAGPYKLMKAHYAEADWFKKSLQSEYFISDVFMGLRRMPHFIVAVRKVWDGKPWILRSTINFMAFNSLVENLRIGKTGFAFILNREGQFQTEPAFDAVPRHTMTSEDFLKGGARKTKDGIYILEKKDDLGKKIYVAAYLKDGDWLMIYQQDTKDAFSDLIHAQKIAFAIFVLAGIAIISVALFLSKVMVSRIVSADREKEMMNQQVIETGKLASIGQLAAGIAHEINNPVAIMVEEAGWIQDLLEEEDLKECENLDEFKRALAQINTQGKRCKEITHKLLSFARKTDSRTQEVQINELINELVSLSAQRAKYSNVTIETKLCPHLPELHMSQTELQQVLLNLINNALDAMDKKGGTLTISTRKEDDNQLTIEMADNGPGIPRANLARIFDPFFTTKPVGKGTGLGLSICYGIVKKMGGEIDVQSVVDMGTTFFIRLPIEK